MKTGYIYKFSCGNGKYWIVGSSINRNRKSQYLNQLRRGEQHNPYLQNVFNKYAELSCNWEVLQKDIPENILTCVEDIWIGALGSRVEDRKGGLNMKDAFRPILHPETVDKIRKKAFGRHPTEEVLQKMRDAKLGKKQAPEHVESRIKHRRGAKASEEWKKNMSKIMKGNKNGIGKSKGIILQKDLNGNLIKQWTSMTELCKETKFPMGKVSECCHGKLNHYNKFKFEKLGKQIN